MAINTDALAAIVAKLVADVPAAVSKQEAEAQAKIDALTAQLTSLEDQLVPPVPPVAG